MSEYKEFWIAFGGDPSDDKECYKRYSASAPFKAIGHDEEIIHLIEYKAYEELRRETDKLVEAIERYIDDGDIGVVTLEKALTEFHKKFPKGD